MYHRRAMYRIQSYHSAINDCNKARRIHKATLVPRSVKRLVCALPYDLQLWVYQFLLEEAKEGEFVHPFVIAAADLCTNLPFRHSPLINGVRVYLPETQPTYFSNPPNNGKATYLLGQKHSYDGEPAHIEPKHRKILWYQNGKIYRKEGGPAVISRLTNVTKHWFYPMPGKCAFSKDHQIIHNNAGYAEEMQFNRERFFNTDFETDIPQIVLNARHRYHNFGRFGIGSGKSIVGYAIESLYPCIIVSIPLKFYLLVALNWLRNKPISKTILTDPKQVTLRYNSVNRSHPVHRRYPKRGR